MTPVIPDAALQQHLIALGKTGAGKSSVLRLLVERLFEQARPPCAIIDPKGDWWGLKSSADGKHAGYPIVIFGGEHADLPLNAHAGAQVAELVATGNRPSIVDLGGWQVGERTRFFIEFASALFRHTRGPRHLVIDEVHNFAPQGKVLDPDAGKMLHWANRLASEGRGKGITLLAASQRPQKVHKDFVTSCETLLAMRVIHPLDRNAIKEWIDGCPDAAKGRDVLATLATMARGEGWVWSPEIGFGPQRVKFPLFRTYDSFAAPTGQGTEKLKGWAEVDLEEVRAKLATVVKEAEANDPKLLRVELAKLRAELRQKEHSSGPTPAWRAEYEEAHARDTESANLTGRAAGRQEVLERLASVDAPLNALADALAAVQLAFQKAQALPPLAAVSQVTVKRQTPAHVASRRPAQAPQRASANPDEAGVGNSGLRRMLIALAQRPRGLSHRSLGVRAGMSSRSGTFSTYLSRARSAGWVNGSGSQLQITRVGLMALGVYEPLPEGHALLEYWLRELGASGAARILSALAEVYPRSLGLERLGELTNMSSRSGTFSTYLSRLRSLELIVGRGELRASEELFDG